MAKEPDLVAHRRELLAAEMAEQLKTVHGDLKAIKGLAGAVAAVPKVILAVEKAGRDNDWHGLDKKQLAIAIILNLVPLPIWLPRAWAVAVLTFAIEKAVAQYNSNAAPFFESLWRTVSGWFRRK